MNAVTNGLCCCGLCLACAPAAEPIATQRTVTVRTTAALSRHLARAAKKASLRCSVTPISGDVSAESRLVQVALEREPAGLARAARLLQRTGAETRSMSERAALADLQLALIGAIAGKAAA